MEWFDVMLVLLWIGWVGYGWGKRTSVAWAELVAAISTWWIWGLWGRGALALARDAVPGWSMGLEVWLEIVGVVLVALLVYSMVAIILEKVIQPRIGIVSYLIVGLLPSVLASGLMILWGVRWLSSEAMPVFMIEVLSVDNWWHQLYRLWVHWWGW